jgi:hypothetical protein
LATILGAAFHFIFGGDIRRLASFLVAGWIGFAIGHYAGIVLRIEFLNIGALHALSAAIGALIALAFVYLLTQNRPKSSTARSAPRRTQKSAPRPKRRA